MTVDRDSDREELERSGLQRLIALARERPREPEGARARLMARIRGEAERARGRAPAGPDASVRSAWGWWLRPVSLRVRPASVALALAGAVLALWIGVAPPGSEARRPGGDGAVQFVHLAPGATSVSLVGDFNDWRAGATPLRRTGPNGVWSAEVPLSPGRHAYAFLVDDVWMADPFAPSAPEDGFGTPTSVVVVGGEGRS